MTRSIWIGFDPREVDAFQICVASIRAHLSAHNIPIYAVALEKLQEPGLYTRPMEMRNDQMWDKISSAPMSTAFAISRFFVPHLADGDQALFMDCDMLVRTDLAKLFDLVDPAHAISCVKHAHEPVEGIKMDGQIQTAYPRKNWSSFMVWNLNHPAHRWLTLDFLNGVPGRVLHRFGWLKDDEIGELPREWNHLVGVNEPDEFAKVAHFTLGIPRMRGYEECEHAPEWWQYAFRLGLIEPDQGINIVADLRHPIWNASQL